MSLDFLTASVLPQSTRWIVSLNTPGQDSLPGSEIRRDDQHTANKDDDKNFIIVRKLILPDHLFRYLCTIIALLTGDYRELNHGKILVILTSENAFICYIPRLFNTEINCMYQEMANFGVSNSFLQL